jgi:uncharacterized protein
MYGAASGLPPSGGIRVSHPGLSACCDSGLSTFVPDIQCIYTGDVDVRSALDGQVFVWNAAKAASNVRRHGVRFEDAQEALLDPLARFEDASANGEARMACIGLTTGYRLLYVVHVAWEGDVLRVISARLAEAAERRRYEDE